MHPEWLIFRPSETTEENAGNISGGELGRKSGSTQKKQGRNGTKWGQKEQKFLGPNCLWDSMFEEGAEDSH